MLCLADCTSVYQCKHQTIYLGYRGSAASADDEFYKTLPDKQY
jgi:hypothetical protein